MAITERARARTALRMAPLSVRVLARTVLLVLTLAIVGLSTPAASPAQVYFNDPGSTGPVEPTAFGPMAEPFDGQSYVFGVKWSSWGEPEATGTGRVRATNNVEIADPVTISLSGLMRCHGQLIYTRYALGVAPGGQPGFDWSRAKSGVFPCQVTAGNVITPRFSPHPNDYKHCAGFSTGRWVPELTPRVPTKPNVQSDYCAMRWTRFGNGTTVGLGVFRDLFRQWPVKAKLSGIAWCPGTDSMTAMSYTRLSMKLYGNGVQTETTTDQADEQAARRLRRDIGRRGLKVRTYVYTKPITPHCVKLSG